ncbi:MAG: hypothetical protein IT364_05160 [Candidatus Hydrogenedentes bacterium]|nr:hypothetical protein [Candidatus Hydrogenedentota bacterium]
MRVVDAHRLVRTMLAGAAIVLVAAGAFAGPATPVLESDSIRLAFDIERGNLLELTAKASAHDYIDETHSLELWRAAFMDGREIGPAQASRFTWETSDSPRGTLRLMWQDFALAGLPALRVTAEVALASGVAEAKWEIHIEGLAESSLRSVCFPRVGGVTALEGETVAVPIWMGEKTSRARALLNAKPEGGRRAWEYPGILSMQWLAVYGAQGPGLRVSTNDLAALRKQFALCGDGQGGLGIEVVHVPQVGTGAPSEYAPSYEVLTGVYDGDWYTAAEGYRAWAMEQPWVTQSRVRLGLVPDWVSSTGLWVWTRGPSPGVLEPAAELQRQAGVPVSVFWHWWHGCPYDVGFPEYLPPREGEVPFRDAVRKAHGEGLHAIVYMNQRLWGMTTQSWKDKDAARYAVKGPDGTIAPEVYNTFMKAPCASMCMGTQFWRDTYAGLAEEAVCNLGVDGIYMDQACSSLACYDAGHGHPLGGGSYWMEGFRALQADIRERCAADKQVTLAGEGCGESWLPYLDIMLSLQVSMERYAAPGEWEPIPLFQAVYHDCSTLYGNYSSLTRPPYDELWPAEFAPKTPLELLDRKFATQFRLEQARAFVWGQQPSVANFRPNHLIDRKEEMDFFLQLVKLRQRALRYLRDGVFLRPPATGAPDAEIPVSRLSIYAGQHDAVQEYRMTAPTVLSSAWRAVDGTVGIVVVNISENKTPVHIELDEKQYPIGASGNIAQIYGNEETAVYADGRATLDIILGPCEARVYEVVPGSRQ